MLRLTAALSTCIVMLAGDVIVLYSQECDDSRPTAASAKSKKLPLLVLEGTPYQRGHTHGKALKGQIRKVVGLWKDDLKRQYNTDPDQFIKLFVQETEYRLAIQKWAPELLEEIKGIADGAGVDFNTMYVFQFLDEVWARKDLIRGHCSSLGFNRSETEPAYVAQTVDLETFRDGYQVVLHIKHEDSDIESLILSNAGCIGWCGVNNRSIGISNLAVSQLKNCRDGLPANCIVRGVLMQPSEQEAVDFVGKRIKHASGLSYIISGPDRVYCFECSANKVVRFQPNDSGHAVWHTNHPLANDDYIDPYKAVLETLKREPAKGWEANSRIRLESLRRRLKGRAGGSRLDMIKNSLASKDSPIHPICGSQGKEEFYSKKGFFTFSAVIIVLGENPELQCTFGPPDQADYEVFTFHKMSD